MEKSEKSIPQETIFITVMYASVSLASGGPLVVENASMYTIK